MRRNFPYLGIQQGGLSPEQQRLEDAAKRAGFTSYQHQQTNRILRNQIQTKAIASGMSIQAAFNMAKGDLTSNEVLQDIWGRIPDKPATPAAATADATTTKADSTVELSAESQAYRKEAEEKLSAADVRIKELEDEQLQAQKARDLQQRMQIVSAANQAMSQRQANLQIAPATKLPTIGGTQQFKRRTMNQKSSSNTLVSNALNI